ncbi:unnamed protein product [Gulo gulo]|uniref:Uncharacterized protein n=1 Tax=Gulo gulo TaxID=48420 RepID=A0A9X9Q941_GULGU|nr:unnamed protein product [Gulo gulo]
MTEIQGKPAKIYRITQDVIFVFHSEPILMVTMQLILKNEPKHSLVRHGLYEKKKTLRK